MIDQPADYDEAVSVIKILMETIGLKDQTIKSMRESLDIHEQNMKTYISIMNKVADIGDKLSQLRDIAARTEK